MTPQEHRFKAERIEQSLSKLRGGDVEIQIEAASACADYAKAVSDWQLQAEFRKLK